MRNALISAVLLSLSGTGAFAADREAKAMDRLDASADVLTDLMRASDKGVPQDLLNHARCVVVVPGMKKAGFILGAKYGRGFAVCRKAGGAGWSAPAAIRVEGGSVGFQIGGSEEDVLMLVQGDKGMNHLLADKFTLGGDATVAAGPIGRDATAQTDAEMHAEILSYSRARGLFAGISLQGATLRPDSETDHELYGRNVSNRNILHGTVAAPQGADKLEVALSRQSDRRAR
jgi:lipid-binding SYLF domain-containing protein